MLGSINLELFFLYLVLVSVLFGKYRGRYAMVHTGVAKANFVGFGIFLVSVLVSTVSDFDIITTLKIAILGNSLGLWAYMLRHVWFAYKASLPSKPEPVITEEVVMLTEEEMDSLGVSPDLKEKLLANLNSGVYDTINIGLTEQGDEEDPMSKYSDDGSVI